MNTEERAAEIRSKITAFSKTSYTRSEILAERLKLQEEEGDLLFNEGHADNGNIRFPEINRYLVRMNNERGNVAEIELDRVIKANKEISNDIRAQISGDIGERKVARELEKLGCQNKVLYNVELEYDGRRTEIDAVVFTNYAVFIVEIKNSKKDIFIDEDGGFFKTGYSMHYDGNIAEKMDERESLLRKALESVDVGFLKIFKIVTFTNPQIDVENKYHYLKVCPYNTLSYFIERFTSNQWYSYESICKMTDAVNEAKCPEEYQMKIDMEGYKKDFASLIAKLEAAEEVDEEKEIPDDTITESDDTVKSIHTTGKTVAAIAACATVVNVALIGLVKLLRK